MPRLGVFTPPFGKLKDARPPATRYSMPGWYSDLTVAQALVANTIYFIPFVVYRTITFNQMAIRVSVLAAGAIARLGLYNADDNLMPSSLIVDAGTVSVATTGAKTIAISQTLGPGYYHAAVVSDGAPSLLGLDTSAAVAAGIAGLTNATADGFDQLIRARAATGESAGLSDPAVVTTFGLGATFAVTRVRAPAP